MIFSVLQVGPIEAKETFKIFLQPSIKLIFMLQTCSCALGLSAAMSCSGRLQHAALPWPGL